MRPMFALAVALQAIAAWPAPAQAACSSSWVTFSEIVDSADQIVIGLVVDAKPPEDATEGHASVFSVQVEEVLRGPNVARVDVVDAINNAACLTFVLARDGDRIALATGGSALDSDDVASVAYLYGFPHRPDVERMTRAQVYEAVGLDMPDTALPEPGTQSWSGWALIGAAAILVAIRGSRRLAGGHPGS